MGLMVVALVLEACFVDGSAKQGIDTDCRFWPYVWHRLLYFSIPAMYQLGR